ncbi:hypothetical protein ACHQM5_002355 [Ranunculus cassubicifolius]
MELIPGLPDDLGRECLVRLPYNDFPKFFEVCKTWKTEIESDQFHQQRKSTGLTRALIILTQAADQNHNSSLSTAKKNPPPPAYNLTVYEPEAGSWDRLPAIPGYPNGVPLFCQCAGIGRYLVVIGGWNPTTWISSSSVNIYDFVTGTWRSGSDMPGPSRSFFGCASDSNRTVYIAGGHDDEKNALRSALKYDVIDDKWVPLPDMANQRDECKGIFHDRKFQVIGGYCTESQGKFERHAEVFDVDTWKWCHVESDLLTTGMCPRNCVVDDKGRLFRCYGGSVAVLDDSTWRDVTKLPDDVRVGPFLLMWREKIFVVGSDKFGGRHSTCGFEVTGDNSNTRWTKVETPFGFTGNVQARCSLEI